MWMPFGSSQRGRSAKNPEKSLPLPQRGQRQASPRVIGTANERLSSGIASSVFSIAAIYLLRNHSTSSAFQVVLDIAISTTLISYLWIFPAGAVLRHKYPNVHRPYRVPGGDAVIWFCAVLITLWVALGTWVSIFPGRIEKWTGISYDFKGTWGVSFPKFEALTLGTLGVVLLIAVVGYVLGKPVRDRQVDVPLEAEGVAAEPASV